MSNLTANLLLLWECEDVLRGTRSEQVRDSYFEDVEMSLYKQLAFRLRNDLGFSLSDAARLAMGK